MHLNYIISLQSLFAWTSNFQLSLPLEKYLFFFENEGRKQHTADVRLNWIRNDNSTLST